MQNERQQKDKNTDVRNCRGHEQKRQAGHAEGGWMISSAWCETGLQELNSIAQDRKERQLITSPTGAGPMVHERSAKADAYLLARV